MGIRFCNLSEEQQALVGRLYGDAIGDAISTIEKKS